jgi:DNA-directed RNA polymerase specialized sigma24 family protein
MTANQPRPGSGNTVKRDLTRKRRKRQVENDEYAAFVRRILRAYARRIANGDIDALRALNDIFDDVENALGRAVVGLRLLGYSWAEIGTRLGVSRQAVHQRWSETIRDDD